MNTFDALIAASQDHAARRLATNITAHLDTVADALTAQLEAIGQAAGRRSSDQLVIAALARLPQSTAEDLYGHAYRVGRYAAARYIARTAGLGGELHQRARTAERELLAAYVLPSRRIGGAE